MMIDTILADIVTYQDYAYSKILKQSNIGDFLFSIKNEKHNKEVIKLREYFDKGDLKRYAQEKIRLPSVTFSGLFSEMRKIESVIKYNDICVVDIDKIYSKNIQEYLDILHSDPYVFSFWLSPSGKGIKGLVKFKYATEPAISSSYEHHKFAFSELSNYIDKKYNIEIDKSGSDVTRLCFVSSDPNLILKEQIEEFPIDNQHIPISVPASKRRERKTGSSYFDRKEYLYPNGRNKQIKRTKIQEIIKFLRKRNLSITSTYESWYRVAYAISNTFTYDLGEKYYLQLCRLDGQRHNEEESIAMLQYCYVNSKRAISFGTIHFYFNKLKEVWGSRTEEASSKLDP
jgi:hypothetical protein